ncbi:MAG: phosphoribosylformylglycinamidine synthase, partial [Candidatus Aenigmatarchaeota archaeon]
MPHRIEVATTIKDMRACVRAQQLNKAGFPVNDVKLVDVYTIDTALDENLPEVASMLVNPVTQKAFIDRPVFPEEFDYAIEVGFMPGVTDNVGKTVRSEIEDLTGTKLDGQAVYTSQVMFVSGNNITRDVARKIGESFANTVIQHISVKDRNEYKRDNGMGLVIPRVKLQEPTPADYVDILGATDEELSIIGKKG